MWKAILVVLAHFSWATTTCSASPPGGCAVEFPSPDNFSTPHFDAQDDESPSAYHTSMLNDLKRAESYLRAIESVVAHKRVLDIGAGTGLLSMFAKRAGASRVTAVERNHVMCDVARMVMRDNGYGLDARDEFRDGAGGWIRLFEGPSQGLRVGAFQLEEPAEVLVSETLDAWLVGENWLGSLEDARDRGLVTRDAVIVPCRATVFAKPIACNHCGLPLNHKLGGIRVDKARHALKLYGISSIEQKILKIVDFAENPLVLFEYDFRTNDFPIRSKLTFKAQTNGIFQSLLILWDAALDCAGKYNVSNRPEADFAWNQGVLHLDHPVYVTQNAEVIVFVAHDRARNTFVASNPIVNYDDATTDFVDHKPVSHDNVFAEFKNECQEPLDLFRAISTAPGTHESWGLSLLTVQPGKHAVALASINVTSFQVRRTSNGKVVGLEEYFINNAVVDTIVAKCE